MVAIGAFYEVQCHITVTFKVGILLQF